MPSSKVIKGLKQAVRHARGEDPIKVPLHVVMSLAKHLQWTDTGGYGDGLTAQQIEKAEGVLRRWYHTQ